MDLKLMREVYHYSESFSGFSIGAWGYQITLPLIWHMQKGWNVQLEPYVLDLAASDDEISMGAQFMIGYIF